MRSPAQIATAVVAALIAALYVAAIVAGLRVHDLSGVSDLSTYTWPRAASAGKRAWAAPSRASIPAGAKGESIRRGESIFDETPLYAAENTGARISCASCHVEGGIRPFASPMVGVHPLFPMFNARAGHVISLEDRIQECFVRSENGRPLAYDGEPMKALVDYIDWVSTPQPSRRPFVGRGLIDIPELKPDPDQGAQIYAAQCAGCHGSHGEGHAPVFPALWGPASFNDGAGMHGVRKMAAFVEHNMPQNRAGILTPQEAWDVSAYIHRQPRPAFNPAYQHF